MRQKGIVTRNMRNAGGPELMDGKETPNLGHLLGGDLCYKNSFCAPSAISSAALETKFSLPGAVSQPREREHRPTSAASEGWKERAMAARDP